MRPQGDVPEWWVSRDEVLDGGAHRITFSFRDGKNKAVVFRLPIPTKEVLEQTAQALMAELSFQPGDKPLGR